MKRTILVAIVGLLIAGGLAWGSGGEESTADEAEKQFRYALKLSENDFVAASVLEDRLKSVYEFRARLDNL